MTRRDRKRLSRALALRQRKQTTAPTADPLPRIKALTRNARNTWFALLGVLVFVGVTLMGVEHIDFYGVNRATRLPLINVSVPTRLFFVVAPILLAAAYGYFHLYLIRLWDVLGTAPPQLNGTPLGDLAEPWLVTDAALHQRRRLRPHEPACSTRRPMETPATLLNLALSWAFGLVVLGLLWWQTMPAREPYITGVAAIAVLVSAWIGFTSFAAMRRRMRGTANDPAFGTGRTVLGALLWLAAIAGVTVISIERTTLSLGVHAQAVRAETALARALWPGRGMASATEPWASRLLGLARIELSEQSLAERPGDWLNFDTARKDFLAEWCRRETGSTCNSVPERQQFEFEVEWRERREGYLSALRQPDLARPDFRRADLTRAFFARADLRNARFADAVAMETQLESADLRWADLERADMRWARLEWADLSESRLDRTNLTGARMERSVLIRAEITQAILNGTQLQKAILGNARILDADLRWANLQGAGLNYSLLSGTPDRPIRLQSTNLNGVTNRGGALRHVDLTRALFDARTDFRNAFLDGSVVMTGAFREQMARPCQWTAQVLGDTEFYGRWRGWVETKKDIEPFETWRQIAPGAYRDIAAIPPEPGCAWAAGPMP